jgi:hypothetical protein
MKIFKVEFYISMSPIRNELMFEFGIFSKIVVKKKEFFERLLRGDLLNYVM